MKKPDIAKQLARRSRVSQAEAAAREILSDLRKGGEPALPGLGKFKNGPNGRLAFERERGKQHG